MFHKSVMRKDKTLLLLLLLLLLRRRISERS